MTVTEKQFQVRQLPLVILASSQELSDSRFLGQSKHRTHTQSERHIDIIIQVLVEYTGPVSLQHEEYRSVFRLFVLVLRFGTIIPVRPP